MNRRVADRLSALILALWAVVLLPGLRGGVQVMKANDLLTPISNMVGLGLVTVIVVAAGYGVAIITGLLLGRSHARLMAFVVGAVSTVSGIFIAATGLIAALVTDRTGAAIVALTCAGGPLLVALGFVGGLELPSFTRSRPRQRRVISAAVPAYSVPAADAQPTPVQASPQAPTSTGDATHDYWIRGVAGPPDRPAPPEPFWSDLSAQGWMGFAVLAGAVLLGAAWIGTRWHQGTHPLAGLGLVALAVWIASRWDARRRRGAR
jgi:hypothetical protein